MKNQPVGGQPQAPVAPQPQVSGQPKKSKKKMIIIIIVVVLLILAIPVLFISCLAVSALKVARMKARDAVRVSDVGQYTVVLKMYREQNGTYPASLDDMSDLFSAMQPLSGQPYDYEVMPDGSVKVCAELESPDEGAEEVYCGSPANREE